MIASLRVKSRSRLQCLFLKFLVTIAIVLFSIGESTSACSWLELSQRSDSLAVAGQYNDAVTFADSSLNCARAHLLDADTNITRLLEALGVRRYEVGDRVRADSALSAAAARVVQRCGDRCTRLASIIGMKAWIFHDNGQLDSAELTFQSALSILRDSSAADGVEAALAFNGLGNVLRRLGRYQEAFDQLKQAHSLRTALFGGDHPRTSNVLMNMAFTAVDMGDFARAESLYAECLQIRLRTLEELHPHTADVLQRLGHLAYIRGRFAEAESLYIASTNILAANFGDENCQLADSYSRLGNLYWQWRKLDDGIEYRRRSLEVLAKCPTYDPMLYLNWKAELAQLHKDKLEVGTALRIANECLDTLATIDSSLHSENRAWLLNALAGVIRNARPLRESESLYTLSVREFQISKGIDDIGQAWPLTNLAGIRLAENDFFEAERMARRALAMREEFYGRRSFDVCESLVQLARIKESIGDQAAVNDLLKEELSIRRELLGDSSLDVANTLGWLVGNFISLQQLDSANAYLELATKAYAAAVDSADVRVADLYYHYVRLAEAQGNLDQASKYVLQAMRLFAQQPQADNGLARLTIFHDHARILRKLKRFAEAESTIVVALNEFSENVGFEDPEVHWARTELTQIYRDWNKPGRAVEEAAKLARNLDRAFARGLLSMTEQQALQFAELRKYSINQYLSALYELSPRPPELPASAVPMIVSSKGRITEELIDRQRVVGASQDQRLMSLAERERVISLELTSRVRSSASLPNIKREIDSLLQIRAGVQESLAVAASAYRSSMTSGAVGASQLSGLLPDSGLLIEYLRWTYLGKGTAPSSDHYLALSISKQGHTMIRDLGEARALDSLIASYRRHFAELSHTGYQITAKTTAEYRKLATAIYGIVLAPLNSMVAEAKHLTISPDGRLNIVSFAGLLDNTGVFLVENKEISYLVAGRDLCQKRQSDQSNSGLLAIGDPDYDLLASGSPPSQSSSRSIGPTKSIRSACLSSAAAFVERLPGTRAEIESAVQRWKTATNDPVMALTDSLASESNFRSFCSGRRWIHIATHGISLAADCLSKQPNSAGLRVGFSKESPLLKSGLTFAGYNRQDDGTGADARDDGFLTAMEASSLDLAGTELVILSACDSEVGDVLTGEGNAGLRRAFQLAGANSVVSTLWPVSDDVTTELMASLYEDDVDSFAVRIRRAQIRTISTLRNQGLSDHPFYWGAFIVVSR